METNKQHWAKEIIEIALGGNRVALINNKPDICDEEFCCDCELDDNCYCKIKKLEEWANAEYHEPVPKLTQLEIEELSYYMHNGYETIEYKNGYRAFAEWRPLKDAEFNRLLFCKYEHLEKNKKYKIKDLLEGQNVK